MRLIVHSLALGLDGTCAAAHASLDLFEAQDFGARVLRLSEQLRAGLSGLVTSSMVRDVRIKGAVAAVEVDAGKAPSSESFAAQGAFVRPLRSNHSDVVYLMPPLNINEADLAVLIRAVVGTMNQA